MSDVLSHLVIFGLGYTGRAIAASAVAAGFSVTAAMRRPIAAPAGVTCVGFTAAEAAVAAATHVITTAPPDDAGDPVLAHYSGAIGAAGRLRWLGYLSSTGVYGDRGGGWVDEATAPAPTSERTRRRVAAEQSWAGFADHRAVDLFRLAGIYGPCRSVFDDLRAGKARRVSKPDHAFGRIHRDDIAAAVLAAMLQPRAAGLRVLNLNDNEPAESAVVIAEAAGLLGMPPPPAIPFEQAAATMTPMARSFWAENRKVSSQATQQMLGLAWRYPSYREGLRAILREEGLERPA